MIATLFLALLVVVAIADIAVFRSSVVLLVRKPRVFIREPSERMLEAALVFTGFWMLSLIAALFLWLTGWNTSALVMFLMSLCFLAMVLVHLALGLVKHLKEDWRLRHPSRDEWH